MTTAILFFLIPLFMVAGTRWARLSSNFAVRAPAGIDIYTQEAIPVEDLASRLVNEGAVERESELIWASRILGWRTVKSGHYRLKGFYSYDSLLSKLGRGIQDPVQVTIYPSSTRGRLSRHLGEAMAFDSAEVHRLFSDSTYLSSHGLSSREELMGRMYPDTYRFYWTWSPDHVLNRILDHFNNQVKERYAERLDTLEYNLDEILTLASIIEREARMNEEKPRISGLYWNRLNRRMYLQADPTVLYALGERRRLLFEDYRIDHPFNTYRNYGLPPGPITNPDLASIKAALYPEEHDYLFMVATPKGRHVFTKTFRQHRRESAKWREWIQEQYRLKEEREREEQSLHPGGRSGGSQR